MIRATQIQAAHFVLQKNYLIGIRATNTTQLVKELAGLPAEPITTPFLSAQARFDQFSPDIFLAELYRHRSLIKCDLVRNTSYVISAASYPAWHAATWRQRNQVLNSEFRLWDIENREVENVSQTILETLGDQSATIDSVVGRLPQDLVRELTQTGRGGRVSKTTNVALALRWLCAKGVLCASQEMADARQDWRIENLKYAPLNYWYPDLDLSAAPDEAAAQAALVRTYLAAFGPASEADIGFWAGWSKSETARATGALSRETTLAMVEGIPGMLLLLKEQAEALKATQAPPERIITALPANDPFTTAYRASRARYFSDQKLQRHIFSGSGMAKPTILVNGQIVGMWEWQSEDERDWVTWQLLAEVDPALVPLIQTQVERVGSLIRPGIDVEQATG